VKTVQLTEARGQLAGALAVRDGYQVMLMSNGGTVIRMPVDEIRRLGRATQGVIVMRLRGDEQVSSIALVAESEEPTAVDGAAPADAKSGPAEETGKNQ
jgi:DNA gyrase subunit A